MPYADDMVQSNGDTPPGNSASLISSKDETTRVLSEQLEAERTASAELRRIVAGMVQRVPELEAAPEPRNAPKMVSEGTANSYVPLRLGAGILVA